MTPIRVFIVDDHEMVRRGLRSFLSTQKDIVCVGEAGSGAEALPQISELKPDVILMDLLLEGGMSGIEATQRVTEETPECRIIILTSYYDEGRVIPALEAGALSYLLKTARGEQVAECIRAAVSGISVIEPQVASVLADRLRRKEPQGEAILTPREKEVLELIAEGRNNQEISEALTISVKTVKTHVSSILSKLNLSDRTQAAVYAHRRQSR